MIEILQLWDLPVFRIIYDEDGKEDAEKIQEWCQINLETVRIDPLIREGVHETAFYISFDDDNSDVAAFKLMWV